jgi:hypothetical protein
LREWEFQTPPVVQATFSGASRDLSKVSGKGQVWFGKTIFRGTLLNSASAAFELRDDVIWCDQVRVTRDEGSGSGKFNCDLGTDRITIDDVEANLAPAAVAAWIDTRVARFLEPIRFTAAPSVRASGTVESGVADNLRIGIDAQAPFTVQLGGGKIPIKRGSAEFQISGVDPQFPAICGMIVADGAVVTGSKFLETLLNRLGPLGFREPLDINLGFKLARESFQLVSFQLTSGPHTARLAGSFYFPGGLVDLGGNIDFSSIALRGTGTIQDPTWQLIPGTRQ